jgi:hypothetical protein
MLVERKIGPRWYNYLRSIAFTVHMRLLAPPVLLSIAVSVILLSCKKDKQGGVPYTPVDISINVNNPAYADIQVPGGWLYLGGGSLGIIVYRQSLDVFLAMDRHFPYQPEQLCRVTVDDTQVTARDTACCHSAFNIVDGGSVTQGPAATALQRYNTLFNGTILRIYN